MRRSKHRPLAVAVAVAVAASAPPVAHAAPRKTLAECVALALRQQPTLKAASATVRAARERVWESTASYLPQVNGIFSAVRRKANAGSLTGGPGGGRSQTFNFYTSGFSLSQVLFDFGQNLALIHEAQANAESTAADADTQRDTVVFDVAQAYFGLLASYRLRDVAEETVRQNGQHLALAQGRFDVGLAPRFDVTQAQVQLANAELNQVTARNNVELGRETLRNSLGLDRPLDFDIIDVLEEAPVPVDGVEALALAHDRRPELRSIRAREEAAAQQVSALEKDYLPKVGGSATYDWTGARFPLQDVWTLGATVNWSVFNGGLTTAQVREAKADLDNLRFTEDSLHQNITLEVRQAVLNVRQATESIRVSDKALQQARENLSIAEGRYATGVGSIIELTDAQASLTGAQANRVQALVNYRTALATLDRATAAPFPLE